MTMTSAHSSRFTRAASAAAISACAALLLAGCGSGPGSSSASTTPTTSSSASSAAPTSAQPAEPVTVRLLTHDSFAVTQSILDDFTARTGITVEIVTSGDAGELVNKAILSAGNPEGDVLFGVDNTLLSRAIDAGIFQATDVAAMAEVSEPFASMVPGGDVVPVDFGDVCVNIDSQAYTSVDAPVTLEDLADPAYADQLVVENPATSSPGLAFMLATIARYGEDGWLDYWSRLRANGVRIVNGWTEAYVGEYSAGGGEGTRPLVVSYASSPPAEIVYAADPKPDRPRTTVMTDGCFRQVEFAGVLAGAAHPKEAAEVLELLLSEEFQSDVPLSMFVYPVRSSVALPELFEKFAAVPSEPLTMSADEIAANRDRWLELWNEQG